MRKILILLVAAATVMLTGCKSEGSNESYTILIYGASGGGPCLDGDMAQCFAGIASVGADAQVNVVVQYNYMPEAQKYPALAGTQRMSYVQGKKLAQDLDTIVYKPGSTKADSATTAIDYANYVVESLKSQGIVQCEAVNGTQPVRLYEPATIAAFIDYAAAKYPADHYILSITGHGGSWDPNDDRAKAPSRYDASGWDDNFQGMTGISAKELVAGIKQSSNASKIICVYQDDCLMNTMENVSEYATTSVPYAVLAFETTYGIDYGNMMELLRSSSSFEKAFRAFCPKNASTDWTFWQLGKVSALNDLIRQSVPMIVQEYSTKSTDYMNIIKNLDADKDHDYYGRNLYGFYKEVKKMTANSELRSLSEQILKAIEGATDTYYGNGSYHDLYERRAYDLRVKAQMYPAGKYQELSGEAGTEVFTNNEFYRQTGWNQLFSILGNY